MGVGKKGRKYVYGGCCWNGTKAVGSVRII